jgi:YegS/Rv2252/BmrU family lipid kinase
MSEPDPQSFEATTWLLALNPVSGRGRGLKSRALIESRLTSLGQRFHTVVSNRPGGTIELVASAVRTGCRRVLVVGGDGSLSEAVNGLFSQDAIPPAAVSLALLPVGTGNDWARSHGLPKRLDAAIQLAANGKARPHDAGLIDFAETGERRWFINVAGTGFDAAVVEKMPSRRFGKLAYLIGLLRGLSAYKSLPLRLDVNGQSELAQSLVAFACIGSTCGGGMKVAPAAKDDDGLIDVVLIRYLKPLQIIRDIRCLFDGSIVSHPKVSIWKTAQVALSSPERIAVEADGEPVGQLPALVRILPGALSVVRPYTGS